MGDEDPDRLPWGRTVDEWPLPTEQDAVDEYVDTHAYLEHVDSLHVDELNQEYVDTIARNSEWHIFRCYLLGSSVYIWNHAIGGGVVIEEPESFLTLADCIQQYTGSDTSV